MKLSCAEQFPHSLRCDIGERESINTVRASKSHKQCDPLGSRESSHYREWWHHQRALTCSHPRLCVVTETRENAKGLGWCDTLFYLLYYLGTNHFQFRRSVSYIRVSSLFPSWRNISTQALLWLSVLSLLTQKPENDTGKFYIFWSLSTLILALPLFILIWPDFEAFTEWLPQFSFLLLKLIIQLIIHIVKTKNVWTVTAVWICDLN